MFSLFNITLDKINEYDALGMTKLYPKYLKADS